MRCGKGFAFRPSRTCFPDYNWFRIQAVLPWVGKDVQQDVKLDIVKEDIVKENNDKTGRYAPI